MRKKLQFTPARTLLGDDADVTGIETMEETPAAEKPFDVYDLRGRKVLRRVTSLDGLPATFCHFNIINSFFLRFSLESQYIFVSLPML